MNLTAITAVLETALTAILSLLQSTKLDSATIDGVLNTLVAVLPYLGQLGDKVLTIVQNIIAGLQSGSQTLTAQQIAAVDAINQMVDADYVSAMSAYLKNHPAAPAPATPAT